MSSYSDPAVEFALVKMENPEEILQALDQFSRLKPKEIPAELEEYLRYVAKTGNPVYQWSLLKPLFVQKLNNVITEFFESSPILEIPPSPNVEPFNYERMKTSLVERLDTFVSAPFTIQRISELLVSPRSEYNRIDKYMRAIEKNVLVVSTRDTFPRSHLDNDKNQEVINGIPENNGTTEDVDVNMLNSELGLQSAAPPPADELMDIKADELEMDSLLIENIPDDNKWVKTDNITSDINSVVSMAAEMTSAQNAVEMSTDIDLVSTPECNPEMVEAPMQPESVPETNLSESTIEPMCIEPNPANLIEAVTSEPMAIEPVVDTVPIQTNEMVQEPDQTASQSTEVSNSLESTESISSVETSMPEKVPTMQPAPTTINSICTTTDSNVVETEEKVNLVSDESLTADQSLSENESLTAEVSSTLNVLLAENEAAEPPINNELTHKSTEYSDNVKDEAQSEMLIESSTDATTSMAADSQDSSEAQANINESSTNDETSTSAAPKAVSDATSTSSTDIGTSSKEGVSTTTEESASSDADSSRLPIVTLPEDETSNDALTAPSSDEPSDGATSSNATEDILVTLLADNDSLGTADEIIAPTPVIIEPQEEHGEKATTSTSEEVTEV